MGALKSAFESLGYQECALDADGLEPGVEKVALFSHGGVWKHAAIQLEDGTWRSKLGVEMDIEHPLRALEGSNYGLVSVIMRRSRNK